MHDIVADRLAQLYGESFGGKERGRFRISMKLLRQLAGRKRLYSDDIQLIGTELFERGYILIDMETFFAVLSQPTLTSYRRVNTETVFAHTARRNKQAASKAGNRGHGRRGAAA